ncbi:hypothetical protein NDU88_003296 [Pleurodeles waltl]|uniref:Uncharacterized protein n=1 Tax=Pleurodeles waltl TaxID=8319 RepID=A0AAV7RG62_PLEWA|nr:hypothetical protein NDU88_003296 [Pleurodeles waltl]
MGRAIFPLMSEYDLEHGAPFGFSFSFLEVKIKKGPNATSLPNKRMIALPARFPRWRWTRLFEFSCLADTGVFWFGTRLVTNGELVSREACRRMVLNLLRDYTDKDNKEREKEEEL